MEFFLFVICGFLWAILVAIKNCLSELKDVSARLEVANGLLVSVVDSANVLEGETRQINKRVSNVEDGVDYFHGAAMKAQSRY